MVEDVEVIEVVALVVFAVVVVVAVHVLTEIILSLVEVLDCKLKIYFMKFDWKKMLLDIARLVLAAISGAIGGSL